MYKGSLTIMRPLMLACAAGILLLGLNACGRPGVPKPPGPAGKITFPQIYPPE